MIAGPVESFQQWRETSRRLLQNQIPPSDVRWQETAAPSLFSLSTAEAPSLREKEKVLSKSNRAQFRVSPEFLKEAHLVAHARADDRWDLLYRLLYRTQFENPHLMQISVDPEVRRFQVLLKSVRRDIHKMHAFVRFKRTDLEGAEVYMAWHEPEHLIAEIVAPFFVRRFGDKPWSIFTPDKSVHWNGEEISSSEGIPQHQFPHQDDFDLLWKSYYRSIFNPARLKIKAMKAELPPKYWHSLPEAALISELIREAPARLQTMALHQNTHAVVPPAQDLAELKASSLSCQACPLYRTAHQTVFGEGAVRAKIMIVGEQPGDLEDQSGRPFVGPAGQLLDECLQAAGLRREDLYLTNAVKHFKWEPGGKVRIHKKASGSEMHACRPWLEAEIALVQPTVILALGVTAGTSILGRLPKISSERGQVFRDQAFAKNILLSWHPSAILRSSSPAEQEQRKKELIQDLKKSRESLELT